mgnify:CR=1 FL=1
MISLILPRSYTKRGFGTVFAAFFAILFLMPIVLTITNSFMASSEISSNYGMVFATTSSGGKVYIAEKVNLKFIPDMVSFSQYVTVLFKSPEYLLKFWNSVILVGPIVVFQLTVATLASYGFSRYRGRIREIIFFLYIILQYRKKGSKHCAKTSLCIGPGPAPFSRLPDLIQLRLPRLQGFLWLAHPSTSFPK